MSPFCVVFRSVAANRPFSNTYTNRTWADLSNIALSEITVSLLIILKRRSPG